jgi:hypothetical protein
VDKFVGDTVRNLVNPADSAAYTKVAENLGNPQAIEFA